MNRFFIVFFILISYCSIFAQTNGQNTVKRTILIMPSYYMNYDKEYEFLGILIRDSIKAKIETKNAFSISEIDTIYKAIDKLKLSSKDYINKDKVKDVAYLSGSDVAILTKFSVSSGKVMVVCEAFDVLNPQTLITSTVSGVVGPDIFDSVDKISMDIEDKMDATFQPIDPSKLNVMKEKSEEFEKEIEKQTIEIKKTEIENKKIENIVTQSSSLEEVLKLKYSGISLGTKYELAEMIIKGSNFDREIIKNKKETAIVFKGCLNSIFASQETILNFKDNVLTDLWILAGETTETESETDIKNLVTVLRKDFGKELTDNKFFTWQDNKIAIELTDLKTKNGRTFLFIHSYLSGQSTSIDKIINYPEYQVFQKAINFSVGFDVNLTSFTKWVNYFAFKKSTQSAPLSPDNYTTSYNRSSLPAFILMKINFGLPIAFDFYNRKISSGILIEPSYSINLASSTKSSSSSGNSSDSQASQSYPLFVHSFNLNLSGRNKFNFKTIGNSLIFEYGLLTKFDYIQNLSIAQSMSTDSWSDNGNYQYFVLYLSNMYFSTGPIVNLAFEFQNHSYSHQVGIYLAGTFGFSFMKIMNNILYNFNANILFGISYRFNYYNLKIQK